MYYTPKEIEKIANPSIGTGAFLEQSVDSVVGNPPYGFPTQHAPDRLWCRAAGVLVVVIVLLAVALIVIGGR